jgi:hypothetical protein
VLQDSAHSSRHASNQTGAEDGEADKENRRPARLASGGEQAPHHRTTAPPSSITQSKRRGSPRSSRRPADEAITTSAIVATTTPPSRYSPVAAVANSKNAIGVIAYGSWASCAVRTATLMPGDFGLSKILAISGVSHFHVT